MLLKLLIVLIIANQLHKTLPGQSCVLQDDVSTDGPVQSLPPTQLLALALTPIPQVLVHSTQEFHTPQPV